MAEGDAKSKLIWGLGGFALVILASLVVWLALQVAALRERFPADQRVEEVAAAAEPAAPPLPRPVPGAGAGPGARARVTPPAAAAAEDEEAPPMEPPLTPEEGRKLAKELGEKGIPDDVTLDSDPIPPPKQGGFKSEAQFLERLGSSRPEVVNAKLGPEEVERFREVFCTKYRPEMAVGSVMTAHSDIFDEDPELQQGLTGAIYEKWMSVNVDASPEDFARADARVLNRLRDLLPAEIYQEVHRVVSDTGECGFIPDEATMQKHAWIFQSLMDQGFRKTLEGTEDLLYQAMVPERPEGVDPEDPKWKDYVKRYASGYRPPDYQSPEGGLPLPEQAPGGTP